MLKQNGNNPNPVVQTGSNVYDKYFKGKEFYYLFGFVALISFFVYRDFILLKKIYLFKDIGSDSLNAVWPYMLQVVNSVKHHDFLNWNFAWGMGQNASSYAFYDPFSMLLYPIGNSNMMYFIGFREILKIFLSTLFFYKFLKLLDLNNFTALIGSLLYGFTGYMILGGAGWYIFSFEAFNMALLLWSFEMFFQKGKWYWLPFPIMLICISRPFNLWMFGIFLFIYMIFRIYQSQGKFELKFFWPLALKLLGLVILGIGLTGPQFLEHLQVMIDSPRSSGPDSQIAKLASAPMFATADKLQLGTEVMRFFSSDILGTGNMFKGWSNYMEAPMFYSGLITLLLFPQIFQFLDKRMKRVTAIILAIWLLPVIFPYFRQAFSLFSGDYYRAYSFFVGLMLMIFGLIAFHFIVTKRTIKVNLLIGTALALIILVNFPFFKDKEAKDSTIVLLVVLLLILYTIFLYFIGARADNQKYKVALLVFVVFELTSFSWYTVNRRDHVLTRELKEKVGYNDYTVEAVDYIKKTEKWPFYRIDKGYSSSPAMHGSLNDAMIFDYFGTSCYNSFNQKNYINYLRGMSVITGVNEYESRWANGLMRHFMTESTNAVKYVLLKQRDNAIWFNAFDSVAKFGDVFVLKNKNVLPLGFAYDRYLRLSDFEKMSPQQKEWVNTIACAVNDDEYANYNKLRPYELKDTIPLNMFTFPGIAGNCDTLKKHPFNITSFTQTDIKGEIDLPKTEMVYFSIPFDKDWKIQDSGKDVNKVMLNNGMIGAYLDAGKHQLELSYSSSNWKKGTVILIISVLVFLVLLAYTLFRKPILKNS